MAQIKANGVDAYVKRPDPRHKLVLIYGPDTGLVSERAAALAKASGADLNDPFSTIRMASDDVAADPSRLADEAHTVSMFGGTRLIWLSGHTARNLVNSVQPLLDLPPEDALVLIEAGDLKKSAPLRTRIEKSDHAVALPCFQDQEQAIDQIISEEMQQAGLNIPNDTRMLLKSHLGGDRMASRGEVKKLAL